MTDTFSSEIHTSGDTERCILCLEQFVPGEGDPEATAAHCSSCIEGLRERLHSNRQLTLTEATA